MSYSILPSSVDQEDANDTPRVYPILLFDAGPMKARDVGACPLFLPPGCRR